MLRSTVERFENETTGQRLMSPARMLSHNLSIVLQTLSDGGPLSQSDLARTLGCSKSTISSNIALLEKTGLVIEAGSGNPRTGRKPTLLQFNPEACFFVAVDLRWKKVDLAVVDMAGRIRYQFSYKRTDTEPAALIQTVKQGIPRLLEGSSIGYERIEGIGIMVPGIVDTHSGVVRYSSVLGWDEEVPLARLLAASIERPITVHNNANALALGEMWVGSGRGYSHLAYIYTEGGLGGACLYNGEVVLGHDGAAGEFGKMLITSAEGPRRSEQLLSLPYLLSRDGNTRPESMDHEQAVRKATELLGGGDGRGRTSATMDELIDKMAQLVVNIVVVFDPQVVVLNWSYLPDPEVHLSRVQDRVREYLPRKPLRSITILPAGLDDRTEVIGAAAAAISHSRFRFVVHGGGCGYERRATSHHLREQIG